MIYEGVGVRSGKVGQGWEGVLVISRRPDGFGSSERAQIVDLFNALSIITTSYGWLKSHFSEITLANMLVKSRPVHGLKINSFCKISSRKLSGQVRH